MDKRKTPEGRRAHRCGSCNGRRFVRVLAFLIDASQPSRLAPILLQPEEGPVVQLRLPRLCGCQQRAAPADQRCGFRVQVPGKHGRRGRTPKGQVSKPRRPPRSQAR